MASRFPSRFGLRAALYLADELFFTGTAAEVTPIRSVDRIPVGEGRRGPVTERIQKLFFDITSGVQEAPAEWLTFIRERATAVKGETNGHKAVNEISQAASNPPVSDSLDAIHVTLTD